jgi:phasin family protein
MTNQTFDATALLETYRTAFAPALAAQQEAMKSFERLARYQYALIGDCLEWSVSQAQALATAKSPAEIVAKQTELGTKITEQLRGRVQELTTITSEAQSTLNQLFTEASAKVAEMGKKAA